jgi:hypothetical protein
MAYKLQISEPKLNLNFNVKYENLSKYERPDVEAKAPDGTIVKERTTYQGQVLGPGSTNRQCGYGYRTKHMAQFQGSHHQPTP